MISAVAESKDSIVERRLRYIDRQRRLGHGVDVKFEGLKPRGSGPKNRHGDEFMALPQAVDVSDFHCVTTWSRLDNHWSGVRFQTIAELAVPKDEATWVLTTGHDRHSMSGEPYTTNLPLARAIEEDHAEVVRMEGAKWIRRIEFLESQSPGVLGTARLFGHGRTVVQRSLQSANVAPPSIVFRELCPLRRCVRSTSRRPEAVSRAAAAV